MVFRDPQWLGLLPVLILAGWMWRGLKLHQPLRAAILLVTVFLLMRPQWRRLTGGMDLWVLLDRSASTEARVDQGFPEWKRLLESGKPRRGDEVHFVDFAADAVPQELNAGGPYTGSRAQTRTGSAVQQALALRDENRPARILVFTDGFSTEPLTGVAEKLAGAKVPLDFRLLSDAGGGDFQLRRLQLPGRTQVNEPFLVEVEVTGPADGPVPLTVSRNGQKLTDSEVVLTKGRGVARFTDRLGITGSFRYEAQILPKNDSHLGNNRYEGWIEIGGGPRLLLVTNYIPDPLEAVLQGQGFAVEVVSDPGKLQPGQLSGCRGVILNNVPAWEVPADFLNSLKFFVNFQGGGLMMAGGRKSFGSGGYFRSAIDELLPVSMELKKDQKKLAAAMVIVMDRSGSMAATVGGGTKMDLANEGAARAVELLGYQDMVGVYAVDSEAHEVVGLQQIGSDDNRGKLNERIRKVRSEGGGIFVYNGLKAGWEALKNTQYGTRHLILFADAADAEQPEDYINLLAQMTAEGGTVSVIALGLETDSDAAFLKDVATRGNGRIFFTDRAEDLPNVFTAETVAVARSAFVKDPVPASANGLWAEVAGRPLDWLGEVDGYNLSYRRDWASQGLVSKDEFEAPLVAWGQRGSGRSAAVSFPLGGEFSDRVRAWPKYGDFAQTLSRWLLGQDLPAGLGLRWDVTGTELSLDLMYDDEWEAKFAAQAPRIALARGMRAEAGPELTWQRMSPGHYRAAMTLEEGDVIRGAVQAGQFAIPFGPLSAGSNVEWMFDTARVEELRQTAAESGGRELLDLKDAWKAPPVTQFTDLRLWLLPVLLGLVLTEALATRLGWSFAELWSRRARRPAAAAQGQAATPQPAAMASDNAGADQRTSPPVLEKNAAPPRKPESRDAAFSPVSP
ncbi:MAG: VWA domain-containing protein, partial [Verrucomicrobiaceae bacterium]